MTQETYEVLESLCDMFHQFCVDKKGVQYLMAVEDCRGVLIQYELLIHNGKLNYEVDWDKLKAMKPVDSGVTVIGANTVQNTNL